MLFNRQASPELVEGTPRRQENPRQSVGLLSQLESAKIHFTVGRHRSDTVMVSLTLVGERVEIDVFEDGHMEVSRFKGHEAIVGGADSVQKLIEENRE